jgi:hypothetical protein
MTEILQPSTPPPLLLLLLETKSHFYYFSRQNIDATLLVFPFKRRGKESSALFLCGAPFSIRFGWMIDWMDE